MTPVTARPVRKPSIRLVVSFPRSTRNEEPARRSSASPIRFMPNRNRHSPPIMVRTLKISIESSLSFGETPNKSPSAEQRIFFPGRAV